ncbi:hypothetical protein KAU09_04450 [Candidatus Parcubacteria bacterium]|nr:hypothetical protein [Candidatus Parcubacteria bacterium]
MKNEKIILLIILAVFVFLPITADARSGCCSWHGGVCGCSCCDGTPLSATCAPYYPWCSGGSSYSSPSYSSPSYSTPSCPSNSSYSYLSKSCKCNSGYVANTGGSGCISGNSYCRDKYGWNSSYNSLNSNCECNYGYILSGGKCISNDDYCEDLYGWNSSYNILYDNCKCDYGYELKYGSCTKKVDTSYQYSDIDYDKISELLKEYKTESNCPINSSVGSDDKCYCNDGYKINSNKDGCVRILCSTHSKLIGNECICDEGYIKNGLFCITHTENCKKSFGDNVVGVQDDSDSSCYCSDGYEWNHDKTNCVKISCQIKYGLYSVLKNNQCVCLDGYILSGGKCISEENKIDNFIKKEKELIKEIDLKLSERLKGKILLQVEKNGEAWYVSPKDRKRYYMANGEEAYNIMRDLGVGITNKDLENLLLENEMAKKHSGKIFLKVEDMGQAYYIDFDGSAYYLKNGDEAYNIMRDLGMGITNSDIRKIEMSDIL